MSISRSVFNLMRLWQVPATAFVVSGLIWSAQDPEAKRAGSLAIGQTGSISGKVTGPVKGLSVVWVEAGAGMTYPKPDKPTTISQKRLLFQPHVLVVQAGVTVDFLNGDDVQHNIFWPAISGNRKLSHSLGTWPKGQTRRFEFDSPGVVPLLCNVHPEMSGYIIVTPTPYSSETDDAGNFQIAGVPAGNYTVTAWHEGYKTQSKPVVVASDAKVSFTLAK